jgi:hypothetical protein
MFDGEEAQHMLYQIGNAPIRDYPFPHFVVDDVFSRSFYQNLIDTFPASAAFTSIADTGRLTVPGDPARSIIEFKDGTANALPPECREIWAPMLDWILSDGFTLFLLSRFDRLLQERFGNRLNDVRFGADLQIVNDEQQYRLDPHTDHPRKVVVLLFYMARDEADIDLGTSFYVPNDPRLRCEGKTRHDRGVFTRAVTFPYRPNSVVGFFKSGHSFHGVEHIKKVSGARHLLQLSIEHGFPGSPDLMPVSDI